MVFTPRTRGVLNPESRCSPSGRKSLSRSRPEPKKVLRVSSGPAVLFLRAGGKQTEFGRGTRDPRMVNLVRGR